MLRLDARVVGQTRWAPSSPLSWDQTFCLQLERVREIGWMCLITMQNHSGENWKEGEKRRESREQKKRAAFIVTWCTTVIKQQSLCVGKCVPRKKGVLGSEFHRRLTYLYSHYNETPQCWWAILSSSDPPPTLRHSSWLCCFILKITQLQTPSNPEEDNALSFFNGTCSSLPLPHLYLFTSVTLVLFWAAAW